MKDRLDKHNYYVKNLLARVKCTQIYGLSWLSLWRAAVAKEANEAFAFKLSLHSWCLYVGNRQKCHLYLLAPFIRIDNLEALDSHIVAFLLLSCHFRVQRLLPVGSVVYTPDMGRLLGYLYLSMLKHTIAKHL